MIKYFLILAFSVLLSQESIGQSSLYIKTNTRTVHVDSSQVPHIRINYDNLIIHDSIQNSLILSVRYLIQFYQSKFELKFPDQYELVFTIIESYEAYRLRVDTSGSTTGIYSPKLAQSFISTVNIRSTFIHEASHAILHASNTFVPAWLDEGLAEMMGDLIITNNVGQSLVSHDRINSLEKYVSSKDTTNPIFLEQYLRQNDKKWYNEPSSNKHYAIGWSLVAFMMTTRKGQILIKDLLPYKKYGSSRSSIYLIDMFYWKPVHIQNANFIEFNRQWKKFLLDNSTEDYIQTFDMSPLIEKKSWKLLKKISRKIG